MKIGGIKLKYFIIVISVIAIAAGIYVTFLSREDLKKRLRRSSLSKRQKGPTERITLSRWNMK